MFNGGKVYQTWPASMYLQDEEREAIRYDRQQQDWEQGSSENGYDPYRIDPTRPGYYYSGGRLTLNITTPFNYIPPRRPDPYERSRARFESRPKLDPIPEKGTVDPNRHMSSLTGSELAEVGSTPGNPQNVNGVYDRHWKTSDEEPIRDEAESKADTIIASPVDTLGSELKRDSLDQDAQRYATKKKKNKRMQICIAVIVTVVVIGIITSAVAIYFSLKAIGSSDDTDVQYRYSIRLRGINMTSSLLDMTSSTYKTLQMDICDTVASMDQVPDMKSCSLNHVSSGSVIAVITLTFTKMTKDEYDSSNPRGIFAEYVIRKVIDTIKLSPQPNKVVHEFIQKYDPDVINIYLLPAPPTSSTGVSTTMTSQTATLSTMTTTLSTMTTTLSTMLDTTREYTQSTEDRTTLGSGKTTEAQIRTTKLETDHTTQDLGSGKNTEAQIRTTKLVVNHTTLGSGMTTEAQIRTTKLEANHTTQDLGSGKNTEAQMMTTKLVVNHTTLGSGMTTEAQIMTTKLVANNTTLESRHDLDVTTHKPNMVTSQSDSMAKITHITTRKYTNETAQESILTTQGSDINTQKDILTTQEEGITTQKAILTTQGTGITTQKASLTTQGADITTQKASLTTQGADTTRKEAIFTTHEEGTTMQKAILTTQ